MRFDGPVPRLLNGRSQSIHNAVVCRTTDEVSLDLARTSCDEHSLALVIADGEDDLFPDGVAAMVIDLNDLTLSLIQRGRLLYQLTNAVLPYPVALASYDLDSEMKSRLKAHGVLVFRRIGSDLFSDLAKSIRAAGRSCRWAIPANTCLKARGRISRQFR
jgi:hypothetical protein